MSADNTDVPGGELDAKAKIRLRNRDAQRRLRARKVPALAYRVPCCRGPPVHLLGAASSCYARVGLSVTLREPA